ncbi:MAG: thiamine pyrophosphate-binding protein, partial [Deltaproteobacteria bacterium]|nr:thiamine pyrophosphate-binding protein [Deltaproteobacteria bacterium]
MGALYNASVGKMPLVITVGQQDSRMLVREPLLAHDLVGMAKPLVKWAVQLQHAEEIPTVIQRAFKVAQDPPRGPVLISLPCDVIEQEIDFRLPVGGGIYRRSKPDPEGINAVTDLILKSGNPAIICGDGITSSGAQSEIIQVAELIGAPVWTGMFAGNLNFPVSHPHFQGKLMPDHGGIKAALAEADLILAVGANLFEEVFYNPVSPLPEGCELIQVDNSSWDIGKNIPPAIGLLADPKLALAELLDSLNLKMNETAEKIVRDRREAMAVQKQEERSKQERRIRKAWDASPISTT